jgi:hypothetical protein
LCVGSQRYHIPPFDSYTLAGRTRKLYEVLPDCKASQDGYLRVIDESGEDYLFPESYFVAVTLPAAAQEAMLVTN